MEPELGDRRGLVLLAAVALVSVVAVTGAAAMGSGADDAPSGEAVLNDTRERYANAESVVGTANVTVRNDTASANATVEFVAAGNRSRVTVAEGNGTYSAGTNGTVAWYAGPNRTAVWEVDALRARAERAGDERNVTRARALLNRSVDRLENASVELLRTGEDDGTPAYVVRVTPGNESLDGRATLWVAKNDSRLLRAELTDGTNETVVDYRDTRFNVSVHDSTFAPPEDRVSVTRFDRYDTFAAAQANTTLALPELNATFREAGVLSTADGTSVVQRYDDAGENVTVVSTTLDREFDRSGDNATAVTVNGHEANVTTVRDRAVVYWESDGVTTAVVVAASEDRAVELARRLDE